MKRIRLLLLTGLILAALIAVVVPAFAGDTDDDVIILNGSFEGDKNGDNIPDKWNTKGDVYRLCNHKYYSLDNCMMVFPPSNNGAALWQILDAEAYSWLVVSQEEQTCVLGYGIYGAINLDAERAFYGVQFVTFEGDKYTLYNELSGGTYPMFEDQFSTVLPNCESPLGLVQEDIAQMKYGVLALPGDGYLGVDLLDIGL